MNTRVWLDPWIPDIPARPAKGITAERDPHLYVDHLIDPVSKLWKLDKLHALIEPSDIPLILSIRPSRSYLSDGYSWNGTKSGNYSVKSGYWAARELSRPTCDHPFQGPGITPLLTQVWKLKTTRKLKHFVWQCLSGCLATNHTLFYRHVGKEKHCPRCGDEEETINHLLFECPPALQTWALSPIPSLPSCFPSQSLFSNLDFLFWRAKGMMNGEDIGHFFPWILWYLWKARNSFIFENIRESPQYTLDHAFQEAKDWKAANTKDDDPLVESVRIPINPTFTRDTPPECQIDGSWHAKDTLSGHGWIVMDKETPILMGMKSSRRGLSPLQAEFETLLWAMECLISESKTSLGFATDCSELISLLDNPSEWPTLAVELQLFKLLKLFFPSFSIRFIPRCNNVRADCLAKKARARENEVIPNVDTEQQNEAPETGMLRLLSLPVHTFTRDAAPVVDVYVYTRVRVTCNIYPIVYTCSERTRLVVLDVDYEGDELFVGRVFKNRDDCRVKLASLHQAVWLKENEPISQSSLG
ncbi:Reverse transcriptase zinc-binding domain [Arabidopsis thaliana x Arabidopsis arenosa]|uniref:Reverse transcriptase zinc-binding domain n=1 Tax=Arabidopsis thaliana x Arabidopsis arenosa TaxID=1240361 RepID=A0A8T2C774_9BRAS|nr:Reverse transcriptase zinc-binding domain [Arabidopsis thaliana x Arabidopsis arenosa]